MKENYLEQDSNNKKHIKLKTNNYKKTYLIKCTTNTIPIVNFKIIIILKASLLIHRIIILTNKLKINLP